MGMNWSKIRQILLTFLIVLSLFLSFRLWTAGGQLREPTTSRTPTVTASLADRTVAEVFSPYQIIWHRNTLNRTLEANTYYMSDWLTEQVETMSFGEIQTPRRISADDYQAFISTESWIEFIFDAPVPFGLFDSAFDNLPTDYDNRTFTRFFINTENPTQLGFYDSRDELLYDVDDSNFTQDSLYELLYSPNNEFTEVEPIRLGDSFIYLPINEVEVAYHDYLVERLPNNLYVLHFFSDTSEVDGRRTGQTMRYIDLTTEVRINDVIDTLTYIRQRADMGQMTFSDRLMSSFQELRQIENWTETVRYQTYAPETHEVTFQRYIQGYPVFSAQQLESTVLMTVVESGLTNLRLPLRVVQTPINLSGETTKTLMSGRDVVSLLETTDQGTDIIQDIRIGLTWVESEEDERVVHFEPDWYVQTQNTWFELDRYIELQEESINGF